MPLQIAYRNLGSGPLGILLGNWCAEKLPTFDKRSVLVFGHCGVWKCHIQFSTITQNFYVKSI